MPIAPVVVAAGKVIGTALLAAALPKVVDGISDVAAKNHEKRLSWIRVPNVLGAKLIDAQNSIEAVGLKVITVEADAKMVYRKCKPDTVVTMSKKAEVKVDPTTTIKLHYVTQIVIDESKSMYENHEKLKALHKKERKEKIENIHRLTKESLKKIPLIKKENNE